MKTYYNVDGNMTTNKPHSTEFTGPYILVKDNEAEKLLREWWAIKDEFLGYQPTFDKWTDLRNRIRNFIGSPDETATK